MFPVIYWSLYGHTQTLAEEVAAGAKGGQCFLTILLNSQTESGALKFRMWLSISFKYRKLFPRRSLRRCMLDPKQITQLSLLLIWPNTFVLAFIPTWVAFWTGAWTGRFRVRYPYQIRQSSFASFSSLRCYRRSLVSLHPSQVSMKWYWCVLLIGLRANLPAKYIPSSQSENSWLIDGSVRFRFHRKCFPTRRSRDYRFGTSHSLCLDTYST